MKKRFGADAGGRGMVNILDNKAMRSRSYGRI